MQNSRRQNPTMAVKPPRGKQCCRATVPQTTILLCICAQLLLHASSSCSQPRSMSSVPCIVVWLRRFKGAHHLVLCTTEWDSPMDMAWACCALSDLMLPG